MLTLTMPQSEPSSETNSSASAWSLVKTLDDSPCGHGVVHRDRRLEVVVRAARRAAARTSRPRRPRSASRSVRSPAGRSRRRAPRPRGRARRRSTTWPPSSTGLRGPPRSMRSYAVRADERSDEGALGHRVADRQPVVRRREPLGELVDDAAWAITRRIVVHRWPAVPAAEKTMPRIAEVEVGAGGRRRPRCCRPARAASGRSGSATRGPTARPIRVEPVALSSATPGWSTSASPTSGPAEQDLRQVRRSTGLGDRPLQDRVAGQRR